MSHEIPTGISYNAVWSVGEWQAAWAMKQDWSPILDAVIASGGLSDLAFNLDEFVINAGTVSLAGTITTDHVFTGTVEFTAGLTVDGLLYNAGSIVSEGSILAVGTTNGFMAPNSALNQLGGTLNVSDGPTAAQLLVGSVITAGTTEAVVNSNSIVLTGTVDGFVADGPVGQVFMGPSNNALGGDWGMVGTFDAAVLQSNGTVVLTDIAVVVGAGAFLTAGTVANGGTIAQKPGTFAIPFSWGAGTVIAGTLELGWAPQDLVITDLIGNLGTAGGSYDVAVLNNGTTITGLGSLAINSTTTTTATASAGNTVTAGNPMSIIVSGISATPTGGAIQVQGTYTS